MTEQQFKQLFAMAECCPEEYRRGYRRGLRRNYHGENFGEPGEHERWLALDGPRAEMGRGYRDGFLGRQPDLEPSGKKSYIHAACDQSDKAAWVRAANAENMKLGAWVVGVLNERASEILGK